MLFGNAISSSNAASVPTGEEGAAHLLSTWCCTPHIRDESACDNFAVLDHATEAQSQTFMVTILHSTTRGATFSVVAHLLLST